MNIKEKILTHSINLFSEKGYDATSISLIAKACKISVGSIYNYFNSKEDIINEVFIKSIEKLEKIIKINYHYNDFSKENFNHVFNSLFKFAQQNQNEFLVFISHNTGHFLYDSTREKLNNFLNFIFQDVDNCKKNNIIKNLPKNDIIALVFGPISFRVKLSIMFNDKISANTINNMREAVWHSLESN